MYKFENFRQNFIFTNSVASVLGHDLHVSTSVNDRVILPFHEGFSFTKHLRSFAKLKSSRKY